MELGKNHLNRRRDLNRERVLRLTQEGAGDIRLPVSIK